MPRKRAGCPVEVSAGERRRDPADALLQGRIRKVADRATLHKGIADGIDAKTMAMVFGIVSGYAVPS